MTERRELPADPAGTGCAALVSAVGAASGVWLRVERPSGAWRAHLRPDEVTLLLDALRWPRRSTRVVLGAGSSIDVHCAEADVWFDLDRMTSHGMLSGPFPRDAMCRLVAGARVASVDG